MAYCYIVSTILGATLTYIIYYLVKRNADYWANRGVTNVPTMPVLGVMWDVMVKKKGMSQVITDIYNKLNGKRIGGYMQFTSPVLMIRDLQLITQVLVKDFSYFEDRNIVWERKSDLFSLNLFNLTGDEWRTARHQLTPTFTSGKLKMMFDTIDNCSSQVVLHIAKNQSQDFNAKDLSMRFVLNTIASVAFGLTINTLEDDKDSDFFRVSSNFFKPSSIFMLKMFIATFVPKLRDVIGIRMIEKDVNSYFRKLIKDVVKYRESTGTRRNDFLQIMLDQRKKEIERFSEKDATPTNTIDDDDTEDADDKELLQQLRNTPAAVGNWKYSKEMFTEDFIAAQSFSFISGGSESTSNVLSFVLFELATNRDCQKRLQQQIDQVLSVSQFNYQAVKRMTYLEQCINETLRNNPLGAGLFRLCTQDYIIPGTDITIEKGTFVNIPIAALHKDPQYFPEPDKFNPDRFENIDNIPKGAFIDFGIGPRMCIASRLAILQMKVYLAKLLMTYDVVLSKKTKLPLTYLKNTVIITPDGGIWVKFVKREM